MGRLGVIGFGDFFFDCVGFFGGFSFFGFFIRSGFFGFRFGRGFSFYGFFGDFFGFFFLGVRFGLFVLGEGAACEGEGAVQIVLVQGHDLAFGHGVLQRGGLGIAHAAGGAFAHAAGDDAAVGVEGHGHAVSGNAHQQHRAASGDAGDDLAAVVCDIRAFAGDDGVFGGRGGGFLGGSRNVLGDHLGRLGPIAVQAQPLGVDRIRLHGFNLDGQFRHFLRDQGHRVPQRECECYDQYQQCADSSFHTIMASG